MKPLFQFTKPDFFSFIHFTGSLALFLVFILFMPEWASFLATLCLGITFEIGQWDAYRSEESIDLTDLFFDVMGAILGMIITGGL